MKRLAIIVGALACLALLAVGTFWLFGERLWPMMGGERQPVAMTEVDPATRQNDFLVCPPEACGGREDMVAPFYSRSPKALEQVLLSRLADRNVVARSRGEDGTLHFTTHSPVLRFPDHTDWRVLPVGEDGSTVMVYARAAVGVSDFGANEKRVREWLALLEEFEK